MSTHDDLIRALGRIEGKLDGLSADIKTGEGDRKDLETRVRKLEQFKSWLIGIGAASGAATSTLLNKLGI